jgi:hypothetical protein
MSSSETAEGQKFLALYLKDHFAGSTGGLEVARRTAKSNAGTEFGGPLTRIASEIADDRDTLKRIMARCDAAQLADLEAHAEDQLARLHDLSNRASAIAFT